jgi:threonine synthase
LGITNLGHAVSLGKGSTPLIELQLAGSPVIAKLDYFCPTGSYKDRGSAVVIGKLKEWGVRELIEDSSGNAGASIAAYAAVAGVEANIYVPESTSAERRRRLRCTAPTWSKSRDRAPTRQAPPGPQPSMSFMAATTGAPTSWLV